jgi:16S rRNA (guanine527-N7)-methyltransferase
VSSEEIRDALAPTIERHGLTTAQAAQLATLVHRLHGDEHAPTTIRGVRAIVDQHIEDALVALELNDITQARAITDLGAGAGLPGLALAASLPESRVVLLESQLRKCTYMTELIEAMALQNAVTVHSRAEDWAEGRELSDAVVVRALAPQPVVLEYAAPIMRQGGILVDWRGRRVPGEEEAALRAAQELGLSRREVRHVAPYPGSRDHHLHVYTKESATPPRFPRRAGMARKRPLGCS